MKSSVLFPLAACGIFFFSACSDNSSSAEGGCPLANQLPDSKIKWEEMTELETGAQYCSADIWGEVSMTAEEFNNYTVAVVNSGFDMNQTEWGTGFKYEFTKKEGDATTTYSLGYFPSNGMVSEIFIKKEVRQYLNGGMDRVVENLTPLLSTIASTPTIMKWQTTSDAASASGSTYKGKTSAELDTFVAQLAAAGWQNLAIEFVVNMWTVSGTYTVDGANYMLVVSVMIVDGFTGSTWETAKSNYTTNVLALSIAKM